MNKVNPLTDEEKNILEKIIQGDNIVDWNYFLDIVEGSQVKGETEVRIKKITERLGNSLTPNLKRAFAEKLREAAEGIKRE